VFCTGAGTDPSRIAQYFDREFVLRRPLTTYAEQIRAVRAGLWLGVERPRVVAVTAARPAEGKSVLALSLARSAALSGEKVLLIDCDMRRPSLGHRLHANGGPGLADLLRGDAGMLDVLHNDQLGAPVAGCISCRPGKRVVTPSGSSWAPRWHNFCSRHGNITH